MKGMRRVLLCIALQVWVTEGIAREMPMPSYSKKSYPYTYKLMDDGELDLKSLCENAPTHEWKECRIKARWDFVSMCQHLNAIIPHQHERVREMFTDIKEWYCRSYERVPIPAHDA
jgi:hypothetical protein